MMNRQENIMIFEELMGKVKRDGKHDLMDYIRESDFYTAPASTKFHLSCEGGLLQHSLNVYECLMNKATSNPTWGRVLLDAGNESLIICALLHDLCKTNFYEIDYKNQKTYDPEKVNSADRYQVKRDNKGSFIWETVPCYTVNDKVPYGHGEKSVMMIEQFMRLTGQERFAIRWHMGFSEHPAMHLQLGQAMEKYPLILALHEADQEASVLLEGKDGNKVDTPANQGYSCGFEEAENL